MASKAVSPRESAVPDLVPTPASMGLSANDIALPRIYIGQFMTAAVQEGLVKPGTIFSATGSDDPDPQVLWTPGQDPVVFHVLALRKGKSYAVPGGELQIFDYDDPAAPDEAWVTYNYTVVVPTADEDVPFKLLLTRTGRNAALQINTVLLKHAGRGPAYEVAFGLTTAPRENNKGKFFVARVAQVEATKQGVEIASRIAAQMGTQPIDHSMGEQPEI